MLLDVNNFRPQYLTEHLPKQFQDGRRLLLPAFKKAREENKKLPGEQ